MSVRRRLRDGLRPCLAVFLAARIGLSLLSVVAVNLIEPLDPVDVPGRPGPPATQGWHNAIDGTERQDAVWYLRLADEGWSTGDASAAFFPLYPLTVRTVAWVLPGERPPRRPPRLEPGVPGGAVGPVRDDRRGLRRPRRSANDRRGGDLPDLLLPPRPLQRVAVPVALDPRVPRGAPRSVGTGRGLRCAGSTHAERRHPLDPGARRGSALDRPQRGRARDRWRRRRQKQARARRASRRRRRDRARSLVLVRLVGSRSRQLAGAAGRPAGLGSGAPASVGVARARRGVRLEVPVLLAARPRDRVDRDRRSRAGLSPRSGLPRPRTGHSACSFLWSIRSRTGRCSPSLVSRSSCSRRFGASRVSGSGGSCPSRS